MVDDDGAPSGAGGFPLRVDGSIVVRGNRFWLCRALPARLAWYASGPGLCSRDRLGFLRALFARVGGWSAP